MNDAPDITPDRPNDTTTDGFRTVTGTIRTSTPTGAIRTLGTDPATAPVMLHPGDALSNGRRLVYVLLLGALTALGPFTIDLYLPDERPHGCHLRYFINSTTYRLGEIDLCFV